MVFSYINSKNKTYYLHKKGNLFYFSQKKEGAIELPTGKTINENPINSLPILKKKEG